MGRYCFVEGCKSSQYTRKEGGKNARFPLYGFPASPELRKLWVEALLVKNAQQSALKLPKIARICILHFDDSCIEQFGLSHVRLKLGLVPTKFPHDEPKERDLLHSRNNIAIVPSPVVELNNVPKATFRNENLPVLEIIDYVNEVPINNTEVAEEVVHLGIDHLDIKIGKHVISHSHEKRSSDQEEHNHSSEIVGCDMEESVIYQKSETPKRKIRYPGDVKQEHLKSMTLRSISKAFTVLKQSYQKKSVHIKRLQRQQQRQKKKIESLEKLLSELTKQNLLSPQSANIVQAVSEESSIVEEIKKGKVNGKYSPQLRAFALTVHFYSPKAYAYIRKVFVNKLPAPSTIRSWYSNTNGFPGFTQETVDILKQKCKAAGDKKIFACITMDEMVIRQQIDWNHSQNRFVGYVDYGLSIKEPENVPLAKDALVYLVTGINERWKIPVAYFLVAGLTSEELAAITKQVIDFVSRSGIEIIALTFDGLPANVAMCNNLGADIFNGKGFFPHPSRNYEILVFLDAAHMLKLLRNALASKKILFDSDGHLIQFKYLENLVNLQEVGYYNLANKLNRKHIQWWKNKMNVKLAAQTFSESCATALEQLEADGHPKFLGCAATAKFCRIVNNAFDCLNSRSLFSYGFKRPFNQNTAAEIFGFFNEAVQYFSTIEVEIASPENNANGRKIRKLVIDTKLKTGFIGFINDMKNLGLMYTRYVQTGHLKYILSYKLSQDHLEILFSCFRAMGGFNNNPNAAQFSASYKRILHHNEVKSSAEANCIPIDSTSILTISSRKKISKTSLEACDEEVDSFQ